ncbi:MAG: chorismate-binding protein [Croceitalea sp.]|nr:chorismate-binding protein [Croceitalea sp.]
MIQKVEAQLAQDLPFVVYRPPHKNRVNAIFQPNKDLNKVYDFTESGFVFAPFETSKASILIKAKELYTAKVAMAEKEFSKQTTDPNDSINKQKYVELIEKVIDRIKANEFEKVVISRELKVACDHHPWTIFERAITNYSAAFCYLWYHPKIGLWIGATPELLVELNQSLITTSALAGTMAATSDEPPNWEEKEMDEQQLVTNYIKTILGDQLTELKTSETHTVRAGDLWHLKTVVSGRLMMNSNLKDVILKLHPTPAVCGTPRDVTQKFILEQEGYSRSYYTGYLGELNIHRTHEAALYVNLRCMQIIDDTATLYVGGGITKASNPEKEWVETQNKSKTMGNLL